MAYSPDILVTALQELLPGYNETFTLFHPCFDAVVKRGQKGKAKNPWKEFALVPEGPGTLNTIIDGDEFINGGRRQTAVKGDTYASTMVYAYDVPCQDLRNANGEADVVGLIKKYPERAMMDFQEIIARQLVMGNGAGAGSFFTFNGDTTYNPKGLGARRGMFEFNEANAQTTDAFGVARNSIVGWHNQYAHITSMGGDGRKQMRKAYNDASQQGAQAEGDVDLMFGDRDSFDNYVDDLTDFVQFVNAEGDVKKGDPSPTKLREGIRFKSAIFYPEPFIDRTAFLDPDALLGVIYGIHSASMNLYTAGTDASRETGGDFAARDPFRLPHQEMFRYELVLSMGMYCDNLRRNFAVTGGAQI